MGNSVNFKLFEIESGKKSLWIESDWRGKVEYTWKSEDSRGIVHETRVVVHVERDVFYTMEDKNVPHHVVYKPGAIREQTVCKKYNIQNTDLNHFHYTVYVYDPLEDL